jgi:tetratricopeptide (TPR) repeat protein
VLLLLSGALGVHLWGKRQFRAAEKALGEQRYRQARRDIAFCTNVWPRDADSYWLAARIERFNEDYEQAAQYLTICSDKEGEQTTRTQLEWTLLRAERGELDKVLPGLLYALEMEDPETPMILETILRVYLRQGRYQQALGVLDRWVLTEPTNARPYLMRGQVKEQLHQFEAALVDYQHSLKLDSSRFDARLQTANLLIQMSSYDEAGTQVRHLLSHHPDSPEVKLVASRLLSAVGKYAQAKELLLQVLEKQPDSPRVLYDLAEAENGLGQFAEAEERLERLLEQQPYAVEACWLLLQCKTRLGRPEPQLDALRKRWKTLSDKFNRLDDIIKRDSGPGKTNAATACEAGKLFLSVGQEDRAVEWLYRALKIDPNYLPAHEELVTILEKDGMSPELLEKHRSKVHQLKHSGRPTAPK